MSLRTGFAAWRTGSAGSASTEVVSAGLAPIIGVPRGLVCDREARCNHGAVNHRLDHAVITDVLMGYSPTVVVVEQAAAGVSLPSGVASRVVVGTATGAEIGYEHLVAESPDGPVNQVIGLDDVCMLPHTSGTTGAPKGVMLTHGNITWNVINFLSVVDFRSDDVTIAIAPFFRTGGTGVNVLPVLFRGGTVIIPEALTRTRSCG